MTRIIGYTYDAAYHCVPCTVDSFRRYKFGFFPERFTNGYDYRDEHGLYSCLTDREGNNIHPVFSTDNIQGVRCDNIKCRKYLN